MLIRATCCFSGRSSEKTSASKCANEFVELWAPRKRFANLTLICGSPSARLLPPIILPSFLAERRKQESEDLSAAF
jgi:hypothetical protein